MSSIKFPKLTPEFLTLRYVTELATVEQIAEEVGCSVANIKKRIKDWRVLRGTARQEAGLIKPWNKGLSKVTDERLARLSAMHTGEGNPMAGKQAWNAGITAGEDPRLAAVAAALRDREVSAETREKMAVAKRGKVREQSNRWRGGVSKTGRYSEHRRTVDGRRVYVHRHVAEQALGRALDPLEHVHHVDCDEVNNVPENLLVLSETDHARLHGAIYRGECKTRAEQIEWLTRAGINFIELP